MRIRGFDVELEVTTLLLIALYAFPLATGTFPHQFPFWSAVEIWMAAILIGVMIVGSILVHELSHAFSGLALGAQVQRIRLFIFGGLTYFSQGPKSEGRHFLISIAGPLSNLALGGLFWLGQNFAEASSVPQVICQYLTLVNFGLGIFNLIPGFPMDGGQALRSAIIIVTHRVALAALVVAVSGCLVGGLLATGAARSLISNDLLGAVWMGLIAFWIIGGSLRQYWDLPDYLPRYWLPRLLWNWRPALAPSVPVEVAPPSDKVLVGQVMSRVKAVYLPSTIVSHFLQDSEARNLLLIEDAAVLQSGHLFGLVTRAMALAVPPSQREVVQLYQILAPSSQFIALGINDDLSLAIQAMSAYPDRPVTVFESSGEFAGLITRADFELYLQTASNSSSTTPYSRPTNPYR